MSSLSTKSRSQMNNPKNLKLQSILKKGRWTLHRSKISWTTLKLSEMSGLSDSTLWKMKKRTACHVMKCLLCTWVTSPSMWTRCFTRLFSSLWCCIANVLILKGGRTDETYFWRLEWGWKMMWSSEESKITNKARLLLISQIYQASWGIWGSRLEGRKKAKSTTQLIIVGLRTKSEES